MKLSVAILATIAALVAAQDPPKMPPGGGMGKGPPGGGMGKGGPPGGGKGDPPGGGKGKGGPPGGGKGKGGGGGFKMPCGVSCLMSPLKESGCKMPFPPKGAGGAPGGGAPSSTSGGAPPKISMDPAAIQGYMDCMCSNNLVKDAFSKCVPEDCQKSGGNAEGLTKMYGSMCKDGKGVMPNFGKMGPPPGGAGPKGPPGGGKGGPPGGGPPGAGKGGPPGGGPPGAGPPGAGKGGPPLGAGKGPAPPTPSK